MDSPVSAIKGVGAVSVMKLNNLGIKTVQELKDAVEKDPFLKKSYAERLVRYMNAMLYEDDWGFIANIAQFVLVLEGNYK
jgi:nucleotidyltransferase/DNA polymerase involved in DNA repair